jgi:hypothetical protein
VGKKRAQVRQVRQQMRKIQPKAGPPASAGQTRRQRERFVQAGGMLQGYAPESVIRVGYIAIGVGVVCLLVIAAIAIFVPRIYGPPVAIAASIAWVVPIALLASFIAPGFRLALKDRNAEAKLVQGQLLGASSVSTSMGLGMLQVRTRGGDELFLVAPARLKQVPGNQVNVIVTITPNLRHVKSVGVMGQRMVPRVEPPVPPVLKRLQQLPVITPIAIAVAAILGDDAVALSPIPASSTVHAVLAVAAAVVLGGAVYGVSYLLQQRLTAQAQALVPKT